MALVKIIANQTVLADGVYYGPDSGPFKLPDATTDGLVQLGIIERVEPEPEGVCVAAPPIEPVDMPAMSDPDPLGVDALPSATGSILASLQYAGFSTVGEIANASEEDLIALPKIGIAKARRLKTEADELSG